MTSDTRSTDEIERDSVAERAQMRDSINDLKKKFSAEAILSDVGALFRDQGDSLGRAVSQTVSRNPAAVAVIGVGIAWLLMGHSRNAETKAERQVAWVSGRDRGRPDSDPWDDKALPGKRSKHSRFRDDDHFWNGNGQMSRDRPAQGRGATGGAGVQSDTDHSSGGMMGTIRSAAGAAGDSAKEAAGRMGDAASGLTERLSDGLEDLSDEARARVLSARRTAYEARQASDAAMKRGSRAVSGFFEDQPLVVGALALALGAAIGSALPRSRIEDDTLGDSSDQLFADAQNLFREERDKARATLRAAATDMKDEIKDFGSDLSDQLPDGKSVGTVIVDRASDAATRVFDRAVNDDGQPETDQSRT